MPRFNDFYYGLFGAGTAKYGNAAPLAFSAEPLVATAVGYDDIALSWTAPSGEYNTFRLLRSQSGFPQTHEDGFIIYESQGRPDAPTSNAPFHDTSLNTTTGEIEFPLIGGRFVFYKAWIKKSSDNSWVTAGSTFTLLPSPHNLGIGRDSKYIETNPDAGNFMGQERLAFFDPRTSPFVSSTHQRFMDLFPRAITSKSNSSLDVSNNSYQGQKFNTDGSPGLAVTPDVTSDAFSDENALFPAFMSAFSFTLDEMLTFASLITPDTSVHWSSPTSVLLGSQEIGMTTDVDSVTDTQRRLLRNAVPIYQTKGTTPGLELLCQSMTGYDTQIIETGNLLLSMEDSTFYLPGWETLANTSEKNGTSLPPVGNWVSESSGLSLRVVSDQVGTSNVLPSFYYGKYVIDTTYCAKVTPSLSNQKISLGVTSPVGTGIPVVPSSYYALSLLFKDSGTSSINPELKWFDKSGVYLSSSFPAVDISYFGAGGDWVIWQAEGALAPDLARYLGVTLRFGTTEVVYLDMVQVEKVDSGSSTGTWYQEPRGAIANVLPSRINWARNPSLLTSAVYWSAYNASSSSRDSVAGWSGTGVFKAVSDGSDNLLVSNVSSTNSDYLEPENSDAESGDTFTASVYIKELAETNTKYRLAAFVYQFIDTLGTFPDFESGPETISFPSDSDFVFESIPELVGPETSVSSNQWTRLSHTFKIPNKILPIDTISVKNGVAAIGVGLSELPAYVKKVTLSGFSDEHDYLNGTFNLRTTGGGPEFKILVGGPNLEGVPDSPNASVSFSVKNVYVGLNVCSTTPPEAGSTILLDGALLEKTGTVLEYFDGSSTYTDAVWGQNSYGAYIGDTGPSAKYPAKSNKLQRLQKEIAEYVGLGTPFYVTLYDGSVYYKGIA